VEIIDAQVHQPIPLTPWDDSIPQDARQTIAVELAIAAMESVGVDAGVVYSTADFCAAAHARYPRRFTGVISLRDPSELGDAGVFMGGLRDRPGLSGVRILPGMPYTGEHLPLLTEGRWEPMLAAAERHEVPVVLFLAYHLPLIEGIARDHPDLRIIVDHLGMPAPPTLPLSEALLDTLPDLLALARFANVAVKFTGVPALSTEAYPFAGLWPRLHRVVEAFGPDRLMWGSDYTRVTGRHHHPPDPGGRLNYSELLDFLRYTTELGDADKEAMFSHSTRRWLRWPSA
jgi:L-fuconolactonase